MELMYAEFIDIGNFMLQVLFSVVANLCLKNKVRGEKLSFTFFSLLKLHTKEAFQRIKCEYISVIFDNIYSKCILSFCFEIYSIILYFLLFCVFSTQHLHK